MNLRRLETLAELADFLPPLLELHSKMEGKWEAVKDENAFVQDLIANFDRAWVYGDLDEEGKIIYFIVVIEHAPNEVFFWLFYMNSKYRTCTKSLLEELKELHKKMGCKEVQFLSTRVTPSYERWVEKFGAKKFAVTYKIIL